MMALGSEGWLHNYLPPAAASANGASESKLAMEGGSSAYGTGRPQSSTSLSPPSHLAMPQVHKHDDGDMMIIIRKYDDYLMYETMIMNI